MKDNNNNDNIVFPFPYNDSVGYGKPPKHTQFPKGKSGNPKGRPPTKILHQVLEEVMNELVTVTTEEGKKKKMTKKEVFIQKLIHDSMKGKSTATKTLTRLLKDLYHTAPI